MVSSANRQQRVDELLKAVKLLIGGHNANPNQVSPSGQTLLHQAAQNEQHVAKVLIHFKVDAEKTDIYGQTSIFYGIKYGCEFLLQHGCAVNHVDMNRQTPIFYSVRNGHMAATDVFLKRGADVEIKDECGFTPISWAPESGRVDTMKELIQKGASTKHLSPIGGDLFTSATGEAMNFSVNELGADPRRKLIKNQTNLFVAAKRGDVEKAEVLIETYGLDVNHQDENGQTCLYYAATYGGFPVTQKLILQFKADVLIKDKNGRTALAFLQQKPKIEQNPQVLKLLANAVKEAQKERAAAAREQKKLPKPARATVAAKEKKERAAAAKEQKKREQEAKVAKARKDKAGASQSSQSRKREASSEEDSSSKRLRKGLLKRKPGQAEVYVVD